MSSPENPAPTETPAEIVEPTLADIANQISAPAPTEENEENKDNKPSLVTQCKEKLKARNPKTKQEARGLWREIVAEIEREGKKCDRANVYKAANKMEEEGYFTNGSEAPKSTTFTTNIPKETIPDAPIELEASEPTEQPFSPAPTVNPAPAPTQQAQQPNQPQKPAYIAPQIDSYSKQRVARMFRRFCEIGARMVPAEAETIKMDVPESEDLAEAALLLFANQGVVDPRILAALQLVQSAAPRILAIAPAAIEKLKNRGKKAA